MSYSKSLKLVRIFAAFAFIISCPFLITAQTSRGTVINPVDIQLPTLNYSEVYRLKALQRERAIESCLHNIMQSVLQDYGDGKCEATIVDVEDSSWIELLMLFEYPGAEYAHVLMQTNAGKYYQFVMPKAFFELWVESDSKGDFYHKYVKNNGKFSLIPICENAIGN